MLRSAQAGSRTEQDISSSPTLSPVESSLATALHCLATLNLDSPPPFSPKEQTGPITFPFSLWANFHGIYAISRFLNMF